MTVMNSFLIVSLSEAGRELQFRMCRLTAETWDTLSLHPESHSRSTGLEPSHSALNSWQHMRGPPRGVGVEGKCIGVGRRGGALEAGSSGLPPQRYPLANSWAHFIPWLTSLHETRVARLPPALC